MCTPVRRLTTSLREGISSRGEQPTPTCVYSVMVVPLFPLQQTQWKHTYGPASKPQTSCHSRGQTRSRVSEAPALPLAPFLSAT